MVNLSGIFGKIINDAKGVSTVCVIFKLSKDHDKDRPVPANVLVVGFIDTSTCGFLILALMVKWDSLGWLLKSSEA